MRFEVTSRSCRGCWVAVLCVAMTFSARAATPTSVPTSRPAADMVDDELITVVDEMVAATAGKETADERRRALLAEARQVMEKPVPKELTALIDWAYGDWPSVRDGAAKSRQILADFKFKPDAVTAWLTEQERRQPLTNWRLRLYTRLLMGNVGALVGGIGGGGPSGK